MLNKAGLDALRKDLAENAGARAEVGIFAEHNERGYEISTNAEIGLVHEEGKISDAIPRRSFLRDPLTFVLPKFVEGNPSKWIGIMREKGLLGVLKTLGHLGENVVHQAFESGGFGQWPANRPSTLKKKHGNRPLIDTHQLASSVSSRVTTEAA